MAESGGEDGNTPKKFESREEKLRVLRERQAEERLRRLEDLKKHALEAQQQREQKEAERRKRMEETREKENERRAQVEGRKKQIWEAERDRREAILRKNQERDARMDAKRRNERSSIVFAFGSSTPRLLETSDSMVASYWGTRRATSTVNLRQLSTTNTNTAMTTSVIAAPRRPSEREPDSKKRASSAGGLYRNASGGMVTSMYEVLHWSSDPPPTPTLPPPQPSDSLSTNPNNLSPHSADTEDGWSVQRVGRRKTDLIPTTPSPRDPSSRPGSGSRSLARTPGRAVSMARLDQLARPRAPLALSRSTVNLADPPLRAAKSMVSLGRPQPAIAPRTTRAERLRQRARAAAATTARSPVSDNASSSGDVTPSRPGSVMSQSSVVSASTLNPRLRPAPRRPRPSSIHVTGVSKEKILSPSDEKTKPREKEIKATLHPKPTVTKKQIQLKNEEIKKSQQKNEISSVDSNVINQNGKDVAKKVVNNVVKKKEVVKPKEDISPADNRREESKSETVTKVPTPEKPVTEETPAGSEAEVPIPSEDLLIDVGVTEVVNGQAPTQHPLVPDAAPEPAVVPLVPVAPAQTVLVPEAVVPAVVPEAPAPTTTAHAAVAEPAAVPVPVEEPRAAAVQSTDTDGEAPKVNSTMTRSTNITTEEEAKAKLAERRRQAREQAEREAEAERQRLAREAEEEEERQRKEEEEQRIAEEEQLRMIEEARKVEEQRLMLAIQEAQKREEEEKERRRLEEVARLEKEEADRLAREEAEKQRIENAERLKKEEEERQARRKRVEAIMQRTRNTTASNSNKTDCEKGEEDGAEHEKDADASKGNLEEFLHGERLSSERSLTNGQGNHKPSISILKEENHPNGMTPSGVTNEDCVNSNSPSPLETPLIAFQGKKETPVTTDFLA